MQHPYHPNGYAPPTNGVPSQARDGSDQKWLRTPTVREALPFTPFSSIVPFNPEVIPPPTATPYYNANYQFGDHQHSRHVLDRLSAGATSAENASKRCQQTIRDVQKLLGAESLTEYNFRKPKHIQPGNSSNKQHSQPKTPELSPFAKMVMESTNVSYRYLTPESMSGTTAPPSANGKKPSKSHTPKAIPTPQPMSHAPIEQHNDFHPPPAVYQKSQAVPLAHTLQAVVPQPLPASELAGVQYIADVEAQRSGKSRTMTGAGSKTISIDQIQRGDAAVTELQQQLDNIFAAEDQFDPDATDHMRLLSVAATEDGRVAILQTAAQEKLDAAIQTVAKYGRLDGITIEDLVRIQKLNERGVSATTSLQLSIGEDWTDDDVQFWLSKMEQVIGGLLASRTLLRTMNAGRQEKELQSEDHVRAVLGLLRNVLDTCLIPTVEERSFVGEKVRGGDKPQHNPKFVLATNHRDSLRGILKAVTRSFRLLATLLSRVDVDESAISSIVYMCKSLIFAENATTDKDSVLGIQQFEETRKYAMDVLGRIFTRYTEQRQFVIDEILVSLEKLPATKQSARQYRLPDCKPIQLVSALLIRLVQTSATRNSTALHLRSKAEEDDDSDEDADGSDEDEDDSDDDEYAEGQTHIKKRGVPKDLASVAKPLHDAAQTNASYIVRILVQRASTTAKNSDEPFRKLMDIFTEDFLNVLGSADWPAAELLLRTLLIQLISLSENTKTAVPARNLGYELMGTMGAGILTLQMQTRSAARNVDTGESQLTKSLVTIFRNSEASDRDIDGSELLSFVGPYRFILEYLKAFKDNDAQIQTAKGFLLVQWATQLKTMRPVSVNSEGSDSSDFIKDLSGKLRSMILDPQWVAAEDNFDIRPSTAIARFASLLMTTNMTFCKAFQRLFTSLVNALTDEHTLVKSRGIKSILTVIETDPGILARNLNLLQRIFNCMDDKSALVRENALTLVQKIIALRSDLAAHARAHIERRAFDAMPGVRKKAFKILKDLYLANDGTEKAGATARAQSKLRVEVAIALIKGMNDLDESVVDLVRTTLEELWFAPFHGLSMHHGEHAFQVKLRYRSQAQILVQSIEHGREHDDDTRKHMESVVRNVLTKSKTAPANERVCKTLIEVLFDGIIDPSDIPGTPSVDVILETLTVFARACPSLMDAAQLERLEPFTNNLTQSDDLVVYRSVLTILRYAMPHVHNLSHNVLANLQVSLMKSVNRLPKSEISEVAACLWTIDGELKNTTRLVNLVASALNNVRSMSRIDFSSAKDKTRAVTKLMNIVGQFGKACDFEAQLGTFKEKLDAAKAKTVAGLAVEIICPFSSPKQPMEIRQASLDAVCAISQRWPKMFLRTDVGNAFELILKEKAQSLEEIFISGLEGFFAQLTMPGDSQQEGAATQITGRERLARTYVASDQDGASSELAQRFLPDIIRLAESAPASDGRDVLALTATKLIASILQQGLPHPKECGPTLVALETSPNAAIAKIAWKEHQAMHQKHETTIEKEYVRSVQRSLAYQQSVTGNISGITLSSPLPRSKLHYFWDVLKSGKLKVKQKFIANICQKLEFEPTEIDLRTNTPQQLSLARYVCENLAFFDYDRTDDLLKLLSAFEKTFASVGTPVAQAIESDIQKLNVAAILAPDPMAIGTMTGEQPTESAVDPTRLKSLALSSQILLTIWETRTFVLHLWGLQKIQRNSKTIAKENAKGPIRATNAATLADAYIRSIADIASEAATTEQQHALCERFADVMKVDSEHKVPSEDEEDMALGGAEASGSEGSTPPAGKGRKRKSAGSMQTTPRKRGRPAKTSSFKSGDGDEVDGWD